MWLNRTLCEVLHEMRSCYKTRNFAPLLGLIEEAQSMGNRMEAALSDIKDVKTYRQERSELHDECSELKKEIKELEKKKRKLQK